MYQSDLHYCYQGYTAGVHCPSNSILSKSVNWHYGSEAHATFGLVCEPSSELKPWCMLWLNKSQRCPPMCAPMEQYVSLEAPLLMREGWKYVLMELGEPSVVLLIVTLCSCPVALKALTYSRNNAITENITFYCFCYEKKDSRLLPWSSRVLW